MTPLRLALTLIPIVALPGCSYSSEEKGPAEHATVRGTAGRELTIIKPAGVSVTRGEAEKIHVKIERENFSDEVRVSISGLPSGVEAVDSPRTTSTDSVELVLRATERADLVKNHRATVTAEGPEGIRASETFEVSVQERS